MSNVIKHRNYNNHQILYEYNTTIKTYASGEKKLKHSSYSTFKGRLVKKSGAGSITAEEKEYLRYKNLYKSKQNLIDLAYHNSLITNWEYFITLTFDPDKVDSKNYEVVSKEISKFINNLNKQNTNMKYILVPELHKSGAVHFHGIFSNMSNLKLVEARNKKNNRLIYKNGCKIYNITNYKLGYTTCSRVKGQEQVSVYISKYMTKNLIDLNFKKRYWSSRNLERPKIEYAYFNEETLNYYIDSHNIKEHYESVKTNSRSDFYRLT